MQGRKRGIAGWQVSGFRTLIEHSVKEITVKLITNGVQNEPGSNKFPKLIIGKVNIGGEGVNMQKYKRQHLDIYHMYVFMKCYKKESIRKYD